MARKIVYRSAIDGEFVTKQYAEENPDTTVRETLCDVRKELINFFLFFRNNGEAMIGSSIEELVDSYLKNSK